MSDAFGLELEFNGGVTSLRRHNASSDIDYGKYR